MLSLIFFCIGWFLDRERHFFLEFVYLGSRADFASGILKKNHLLLFFFCLHLLLFGLTPVCLCGRAATYYNVRHCDY